MTKKADKSLDLVTAQQLYIAAGQPEQAAAAGFVIDAVRNTVQGEWGKSFVVSLENLLIKHIDPLRLDVQQLAAEAGRRLGKLEDGQARHAEQIADALARLDHKRTEIDEMKRELAELQAWRHAQERDGDGQ